LLLENILTLVAQEGKQQAEKTSLAVSAAGSKSVPSTKPAKHEICAPNVVRKVKSFADYYDAVRQQMKEELREEKQKRRQRHNFANAVEFETWYGDIQADLVDASHEEYR
jgi:hypothetical protein